MSDAQARVCLDAADGDLPEALEVMRRAFAQYAEAGEPSGAMLETADEWRAARGEGLRVAVVRLDGRIVAVAKHQDIADGSRYFGRLGVDPAARGLGLAAVLVMALRDDAVSAGRSGLSCLVRASEARNIALYERLGMVITGREQRVSRTGATLAVVRMADA